MSYEHCELHDLDATNGCGACEAQREANALDRWPLAELVPIRSTCARRRSVLRGAWLSPRRRGGTRRYRILGSGSYVGWRDYDLLSRLNRDQPPSGCGEHPVGCRRQPAGCWQRASVPGEDCEACGAPCDCGRAGVWR